jgi:SAM-dependent methyltransferase
MATEAPTQSYSEQWYWDDRYKNESEPFDWYQKYSPLAPLINLYVPQRNQRVLVIGCGNSAFSEGMVDDGYEDVVSIDISSVVIDTMIKKYSDRPQLKCNVVFLVFFFTFVDSST